ncbi:MAG: hypothetical protein H0V73_06140 [Chloroflexi bacterium]|nr:hypothetical protein [Chloroflexota bacterium]
MFSTLLGSLPRLPDRPAAAPDAARPGLDDAEARSDALEARLDDVVALGRVRLELVSDGADAAPPDRDAAAIVAAWTAAAGAGAVAVKQVLLGPYSAGRSAGADPEAIAEVIRPTILALAAAGCLFVEIAEPEALPIATDPLEAAVFARAHRRLIDGGEGLHASLSLTGGNLDTAGAATFFDLAYQSYAFDLIAGPDNWRLIAQAPADRGVVCGALGLAPGADETREVLVWAAHYAASTSGRGLARVGLANAPTREPLSRSEALRKLAIVAEASRIASVEEPREMATLLDRRAVDPRAGSGGRFAPARRRRQ